MDGVRPFRSVLRNVLVLDGKSSSDRREAKLSPEAAESKALGGSLWRSSWDPEWRSHARSAPAAGNRRSTRG